MQTEIVMSKTFGPPDKLANGKRKKKLKYSKLWQTKCETEY